MPYHLLPITLLLLCNSWFIIILNFPDLLDIKHSPCLSSELYFIYYKEELYKYNFLLYNYTNYKVLYNYTCIISVLPYLSYSIWVWPEQYLLKHEQNYFFCPVWLDPLWFVIYFSCLSVFSFFGLSSDMSIFLMYNFASHFFTFLKLIK